MSASAEQATLLSHHQNELGCELARADLLEDGFHGARLFFARENRRL